MSVVAPAFLALAWGGGVACLDRILFDSVARIAPSLESVPDDVVAVRLPSGAALDEFVNAVDRCRDGGARLVAVLSPGGSRGREVLAAIGTEALVGVPDDGEEWSREIQCIVPPPQLDDDGTARRVAADWKGRPTLATVLGARMGLEISEGERLCLFSPDRERVPVIDAGRLGGDAGTTRSVLRGRVALVGEVDSAGVPVTTFVHRGSEALPVLLHQAAVVQCMLDRRLAAGLPAMWSWGLAVLAAGSIVAACRRFRRFSVPVFGCVAVVVVVGSVWWALHDGLVWISPAAPVLGIAVTTILGAGIRSAGENSAVESVLRRLSADAELNASGNAFLIEDSPWPLVRMGLEASFGISPIVLLVPAVDGVALEATAADMGDLVKDIFGERGAQADDRPFAEVVNAGGVVEAGGGWRIASLRGESGVHGFCLLPDMVGGSAPSDCEILDVVESLAGLLEYRIRWRSRMRKERISEGGRNGFRPLHDRLAGSIGLLDASRSLLEDCVSATREVVLVIDVFGTILHRSAEAARWCAEFGIDLETASPAGLLTDLSGMAVSDCRRVWRHAVLRGESACLACDAMRRPGRRFLVHVTPLPDRTPGWRSGIVVQVEDITAIARATSLKDEFLERIHYQLNNDFESIAGAAGLLTDARVPADDQAVLMGTIRDKVADAGRMLRSSRVHFRTDLIPEPSGAYPVHVDPILEAACAVVERAAGAREIGLDRERLAFGRLVQAAPREFEQLVVAVLRVLIGDGKPGTRITIRTWQGRGGVVIALENAGFGVPAARIRRVLRGEPTDDADLAVVVRGRALVSAWGGSLTADAAVDEGIRFQIRLRNVL